MPTRLWTVTSCATSDTLGPLARAVSERSVTSAAIRPWRPSCTAHRPPGTSSPIPEETIPTPHQILSVPIAQSGSEQYHTRGFEMKSWRQDQPFWERLLFFSTILVLQ